jgi:hypothetical protein
MKQMTPLIALATSLFLTANAGAAAQGKLLFEDQFDRTEKNDAKEEIGNGWTTNSKSRAKGRKQVDLKDGAMHIVRAEVADHGVSVVQDVAFEDVTLFLRFKLRAQDDLGINLADMKEKSVHAGHICMARIRLNRLEIVDLKTGRMKKEFRDARQAKQETPAMKKTIKGKSKFFPLELKPNKWHQLEVRIDGDQMQVTIKEELPMKGDQPQVGVKDRGVGRFSSPGIGHPTKRRLRLAVNKEAWVDDLKIWGR